MRDASQIQAVGAKGKGLSIFNTNLVYGRPGESYLIHYLAQCVAARRVPKALGNPKASFKYHPIHIDDIARVVDSSLSANNEQSSISNLNGNESVTLREIVDLLEKAAEYEEGSTKLVKTRFNLAFGDLIQEFFTGVSHDRNMGYMAQYFEEKKYLADRLNQKDFFTEKGIN